MDQSSELHLIRQSILNCEKCDLHEGVVPVPFTGSKTPKVVVIGVGPGKQELKTGVPWSGKAGYYTRRILQDAGINPKDIAWMNVVCCGDNPKQIHIDACRLNCRRQLESLRAPYSLVFGQVALLALLPFRTTLGLLRGLWWRLPTGGWAMATYHPASVLHGYNNSVEGVIKRDIDKFAGSVLMGDLMPPKVSEYCVKCNKWATFYIQSVAFCGEHVPRRLKKIQGNEQLNLLEELQ